MAGFADPLTRGSITLSPTEFNDAVSHWAAVITVHDDHSFIINAQLLELLDQTLQLQQGTGDLRSCVFMVRFLRTNIVAIFVKLDWPMPSSMMEIVVRARTLIGCHVFEKQI